MGLETFMGRFGDGDAPEAADNCGIVGLANEWQATQQPGALEKFIDKFNGVTEPYFFYGGTIELRFQVDEHIYYRVGDLGQLTPQDGVTTICHIIDKSNALVPWSAKMVAQKMLRTIPTFEKQEPVVLNPVTHEFDKVKQCCSCGGYTPTHSGVYHWEVQWADHLRKAKEDQPTYPVQYIPEMTLEAFEKIVLEAKTAPRDKLEEAGEVGHMAHTWLEYYIKAVIAKHQVEIESKLANLPKDERAKNCVMAALGWMHTHNVKWIETERKIYSKRYSYAGTMDGLALVSSCDDPACQGCKGEQFTDRLSIIDWKSSNYLYIEYLYQTAAYEAAYEEEFGADVLDRWILRLGKEDGEFDPWHTTAEDFQEDFEAFLDALSLTRSVHLTEERMKGQKKQVREIRKALKEAEKEAKKVQAKLDRDSARDERRKQKALEKELLKAKKKADREALRAGGPAAQIVEVVDPVVAEVAEAVVAEAELSGTITGRFKPEPEMRMLKLGTADTKVFVDALLNPPEPSEALKALAGHMLTATAVDVPTEIANGTLVTMDFAAIEERVFASLPKEELATYGFTLPEEKVTVI